jgi:hypothetical protein
MGESLEKQSSPDCFSKKIPTFRQLHLNQIVPGITLKDKETPPHFKHNRKFPKTGKNL